MVKKVLVASLKVLTVVKRKIEQNFRNVPTDELFRWFVKNYGMKCRSGRETMKNYDI